MGGVTADYLHSTLRRLPPPTMVGTTTLHREQVPGKTSGTGQSDECRESLECLVAEGTECLVREVTTLAALDYHTRACKTLAVVKFYKPKCRSCRALEPKFEQWARDWHGQAEFFAVNLKSAADVFHAKSVSMRRLVAHLLQPSSDRTPI